MLGFGRIADELEREIGLYAGADVEVPVVEQWPPAVRGLQASQIACDLRFEGRIGLAEKMLEDDVLGRDRGIGFQLEDPMPVRALLPEQRGGSRLDAAVEIRLGRLDIRLPRNALGFGIVRHWRAILRKMHQSGPLLLFAGNSMSRNTIHMSVTRPTRIGRRGGAHPRAISRLSIF